MIARGLVALVLVIGPAVAPVAYAAKGARMTGLPPALAGIWEVEQVAVDRADQPHWKYRPDEPALMGRELAIDADEARFSGGKEATCKPAGWQGHASTWSALVATGQLRGGGAAESDPTPADYGLKVNRRAPVAAYSFCGSPPDPKHPVVNANGWMAEPWLAVLGSGRVVMRLDDQTLLVLARRKPEAKPVASFPCLRAATPTEKTICANFTLAGWDRSVALAWRQQSESGGAAVSDQKEWLRARDACGTDARCLEEKMSSRVAALRRP